jgi:hypothetical protein
MGNFLMEFGESPKHTWHNQDYETQEVLSIEQVKNIIDT